MIGQARMGCVGSDDEGSVLGAKLEEAREYVGFEQEQVARHLGIPRTAVSETENGKRTASALELKRLAHLYQRPVQCFTGDEPVVPTDVAFLARTASSLSDTDRQELQRFTEFLREKARG